VLGGQRWWCAVAELRRGVGELGSGGGQCGAGGGRVGPERWKLGWGTQVAVAVGGGGGATWCGVTCASGGGPAGGRWRVEQRSKEEQGGWAMRAH
jgi:hypothetical protein